MSHIATPITLSADTTAGSLKLEIMGLQQHLLDG
jgi:hypothetical protein